MILIPYEEHGNCPQANICNKTTQKKGGGGVGIKITKALAGQGPDPAAEPRLGPAPLEQLHSVFLIGPSLCKSALSLRLISSQTGNAGLWGDWIFTTARSRAGTAGGH